MNRLIVRISLLTLSLWASAIIIVAQTTSPVTNDEPDFIVPARPTVSNPAEFQRPGVLQIEYGYNANFRASGIDVEQDTPLALRFAVSRRLLLELDTDSPISQTPTGGMRETGAGDTQLGAQCVLQHESGTHPAIAVAYYIKLPTASDTKGLGTGRVDHNLIALVSKKIDQTTVDFNAIYLLAGRTTGRGRASSGQAALAASRNLTKQLGVQGEISGSSRNDAQPGAVLGLGVVTYQINRRVVLDGGLRCGLTRDAPRVGVVAGITVGVTDFYKKRHRRLP
jgi:hypothetical protein